MTDKSLPALLSFLDWMSSKGLMPRNTASGRKAACAKVLGVLDPEERADVTQVDVGEAMSRFANLEGKKYLPNSLAVYRSRVSAAIADFARYLADPEAFKPGAIRRRVRQEPTPKAEPPRRAAALDSLPTQLDGPAMSGHSPVNVFPIPIRADVVVRIHGLPFDLTTSEAEKIANIVKAMAMT
jgi:hypothetical protein